MKVMEVMNPRPDQVLANNFNMFQTVKSIEKVLLLYWTFQLEIIQPSPWQKKQRKNEYYEYNFVQIYIQETEY